MTRDVKLPSGRTVQINEPTFAHVAQVEAWSQDGEGGALVRLQCCLLVPQRRCWLSGPEVREASEEYDLSIADGAFLGQWLTEHIQGEVGSLPLSETPSD